MAEKTHDVIGLGNALMDLLIEVNEKKLEEMNLKKGEFHLVDEGRAKEILLKISQEGFVIDTVPGGSVANTLKGISFLGGSTILCGKVGEDEHGERYIQEMRDIGVVTRINKHNYITGHAIAFITPDAERTFSAYLGAATQIYRDDILEDDIRRSKILHLEGYQLEEQTKDAVLHAMELARKYNTLISIDLSDPGIIRRNKELLEEIVKKYVDIVFLNEEEAKEFTGLEKEEALKEIAQYTKIAIVKLGEKGSLIYHNKSITKIEPFLANAVDTTGAGDTFAAGFLYGYCRGWPLEKAGKLGSFMAAKIVEQKGVKINDLSLEEVKEVLKW